ncbi:MAG: serpin family protein [Candidatus Hydrogenedentes bacterium]|nr:serpin family protein [Candidatus Hydrogenedentota bacterium]
MNRCILVAMIVVQALLPACGQGKAITLTVDEATLTPVVRGNNQFALDLYAKLNTNRDNLFFSPFSVSAALAMTYAGAQGATQAQMEQVLHFPFSDEKLHASFGSLLQALTYVPASKAGYQLDIANRLWGEEKEYFKFREDFLKLNRDFYGAELEKVSFSKEPGPTADKINKWTSKQTAGKIPEIVNAADFSAYTLLVLTNAIYFKGDWLHEFKEDATKDEPFYLEGGTQKNVPLMHQSIQFGYSSTDSLQILEMGYRGNRLSMVVLLPRDRNGLAALEKELNTDLLYGWLAGLHPEKVEVYFPRFKMESAFNLTDTLKAMGMPDAFTLQADFMKMIEFTVQPPPDQRIWIDKVLHKAYVDVNEKGTEAAAATAVIMTLGATAAPEPPPVFRADHPFLFLIQDKPTGSILFLGRVMRP